MLTIVSQFIEQAHAAPAVVVPSFSPAATGSGAVTADTVTSSLNTAFTTGLGIFGTIMGVAAIGYIMWAAFQYITSAGSPDKTKTARAAIINVVIGILIFVAAFTIVRLSISLGSNLFNFTS